MPPIQTQSSRNPVEQECRILLAIQTIKKQEISSICEAAHQFSVSKSTLSMCLHGVCSCMNSHTNSHKLSEVEEQLLEKWILPMDSCSAAPKHSTIQEIVDLLLAQCGTTSILSVGKNWVTNFVKRHSELLSQFSRSYNYECTKCEDPKIITEWFNLV